MASSLIGGLISNGSFRADQVYLFEPNADKSESLSREFGITALASNQAVVARADIVVVAVKPQVLQSVLTPLADVFKSHSPLIVSIVAGITANSIEQWLQSEQAVVRVMPNTPALVGVGASGLYANQRVSTQQKQVAEQLMNAVGYSAWVPSEGDIDSITALSGSGPAYFMLFIQGLVEASVRAGLDEKTAKQLAIQTAAGAAELVAQSDESLQTLIDNVTSPGGTTERALLSFAESNLKGITGEAFDAAKTRSEQLAKELG